MAGATGVIGIRTVPLLLAAGHEVVGMVRSATDGPPLEALGAGSIVCDAFDTAGVCEAVVESRPGAIVNLLTALPDDASELDVAADANARIRREGTRNLLEAASAAGVSRYLAESVAWSLGGDAGAAVDDLERWTLEAGGVILRYGQLYGPGTYHPDTPPEPPRIHIDEAARRTAAALDAPPGIIEVVEPV
jgi:nucleoside-diphosphate-sugar epimerase